MNTPNKKLSTKPLRIDIPNSNLDKLETRKQDSSLPESSKLELSNLEEVEQITNSSSDSSVEQNINSSKTENEKIVSLASTEEVTLPKSRKQDSSLPESSKLESSNLKRININNIDESSIDNSGLEKHEFKKQDSSLEDYKKVAMRLSVRAVERLKQLRMETSIPYEILVDVTIRNWDLLPQNIKKAYLQEAKQVRAERLMAGQQKTMDTMQQKYSVKSEEV